MHFALSSFLFDLPLCLILLEFTKNERKYAYIEDILSAIFFFSREQTKLRNTVNSYIDDSSGQIILK